MTKMFRYTMDPIMSSALVWLLLAPLSCAQQKILTVCDLLQHVQQHRGKEVRVRGELRQSFEEYALYGLLCKEALLTGGHTWPSAIWLTPPGGLAEGPVTFKVDEAAMNALATKVAQERQSGKLGKVIVTFIGKLEARSKYLGVLTASGSWVGNGFGHLNAYPAQLVYRTWQDLVVLPRPE